MPWCPSCDAYRAPSAVKTDGTCRECGAPVDAGALRPLREPFDTPEGESPPPVPWHLKLLGLAVALYLGVRAWQGVEWVIQRLG